MTAPDQLPPDLAAALLPADQLPAGPRPEDAGRLELPAALAELDRATPALLELEARHGFTFGDAGERGPGRPSIAAACSSAGCGRQGRLLQLHDDTLLPVHCGDCGGVVHCEHRPELRRERGGTLAAVVEHLITACSVCGTELDRRSTDVGPLPLSEIPVALLDRPL